MFFLRNLKDKFYKLINVVQSSFEELKNKVFNKSTGLINFEDIKIYHHFDFSYAFVPLNVIKLLPEKEFSNLIDYIINSIDQNLEKKGDIFINIITKVILNDDLNICYIHSLTYKELFTLNSLHIWKNKLNIDLKELLSQYNDSKLEKIELRFDYIRSNDLKSK